MTKQDKRQYFRIGELASLYNIPKQTLIYYDHMGLLVPAFIHENGYRYYAVQQYLILEIILNLRKLDIPIKDIKDYLEHRSTATLIRLLQKKDDECAWAIDSLSTTRTSLQEALSAIDMQKHMIINCFETVYRHAIPILLSHPVKTEKGATVSTYLKKFSRHNQKAFAKNEFRSFATGWIIRQQDFFAQQFNHTYRYFTPIPRHLCDEMAELKPEGLYVRIHFIGTYYSQVTRLYERLSDYLKRNALQPQSDIYILPIKNHWQTTSPSAYINQLSVQVKYTDDAF